MRWLFVGLAVLLAACEEGSDIGADPDPGTGSPLGGGDPDAYRISGQVQKGPFTRLNVQVRALDPKTGETGEPIDAEVEGSSYQVEVPHGELYVVEARGEFTNEVTGEPVQVDQPLQALSPLDGEDRSVNVNLATHLTSERFRNSPAVSETSWRDKLRSDQRFVSQSLGLGEDTDPTRLDLSSVTDDDGFDDADLSLLLVSGALGETLTGDRLFGGQLADLIDRVRSGSDPQDVRRDLDLFAGLDAAELYQRIRQQIPEWSLPPVSLPETPIWQCPTGQPCDWISQPDPLLSVAAVSLYESQGEAEVVLRLSEPLDQDAGVRLTTVADSALANEDFQPLQRELVIPAGDRKLRLTLPLVVDNRDENTETFQLTVEALGDQFQLAQTQVPIQLLDGAPPALANQTPSQVKVVSHCVRQVDTPAQLTASSCAPLSSLTSISGDENDAASVEVDLAVACAAGDACQDAGSDWLVEFALLAEDGEGTVQDEVSLGPYVYPDSALQRQDESVRSRHLLLSLSSGATRHFLGDSLDNGHDLALVARLVGAPDRLSRLDLPTLAPLPEQITAGDQTLVPVDGTVVTDGSAQSCEQGDYGLSGDYQLNSDSTLSGDLCVSLSTADDGTVSASMTAGALDLKGAMLTLPPGVVALMGATDSGPLPTGVPMLTVTVSSDPGGDPASQRSWLHQQGMPVMFRTASGQLIPDGLAIDYDRVRYVMAPDFSASDPRAGGEVTSNDLLYKGAGPGTGTLSWGDAGLTVDLTLAAGNGKTVFPQGEMQWDAVTANYTNGAMTAPAPVTLDYYLTQSSTCRAPECQTQGQRPYHVAGSVGLDDRGFMLGETQYQPFEFGDRLYTFPPAWGVRAGSDSEDLNAFTRPDDLEADAPVTLAQAGYRFPAGRDRASDYLVAHLQPADTSPRHGVHALGSEAERRGNHFPAGLVLGPQTYRDANGQPSLGAGQWLDGKHLELDNGNDQLSLPTSQGAKYAIRNGGVTGVFNIAASALQNPLTFYGYDLALDRFAIRVRDNAVDEVNWFDGHTQIAGDAGLEVHFENLTIDCAGRFGKAQVVYESCDASDNNGNGYVDENCGQRLASWRADTDVFGLNFDAPDGPGACSAGSQQLRLQQQVDFLALNKPVGLDSVWSPDGVMSDQSLALLDDYRMDAVEDASDGFPLVPDAGAFTVVDLAADPATRYGSFDIDPGLVAVPFWESIEGDVRIANWLSGQAPVAEPSLVLPTGKLTGARATKRTGEVFNQDVFSSDSNNSNSLDLDARYPWGNTGFEFKLPVYYSPHQYNSDGQPKFLGRRLSTDLFVMEAGAGINYIEPQRTKLSFGASADFERLQELNLQIDLNNPDNLGRVDQWLQSAGLINQPVLEPALNQVMQPVSVLNDFADKGLDRAMRAGLNQAVTELGEAAAPNLPGGQDPFELASRSLAQVKNFPQQLALLLDEEVKAPIDRSIDRLEGQLRSELNAVHAEIQALDPGHQGGLNSIQSVVTSLDALHSDVEQVSNQLGQPVAEARQIIDELSGPLSDLQTATTEIDGIVEDAVDVTAAQCNAADYDVNLDYGYLQQMVVNLAQVQSLLDLVRGSDVLDPLVSLVANDPAVGQRLNDAQQAVQRQAEELAGYLERARTAIQNQVCGGRVQDVLAEVRSVLDTIDTQAGHLSGRLQTVKDHLDTVDTLRTDLVEQVLDPVEEVKQSLAELNNRLSEGLADGVNGSIVLNRLNTELAGITGGRIDALIATDPTSQTDLLVLVFDTVHDELDNQYRTMRDALLAEAESHLPGAYYSADQLRDMLVAQLMHAGPVAQLREAMNQHLSELNRQVNQLALQLTDQANLAVQEAIKAVESQANEALAAAQAAVRDLPVKGGRLDGYGVIAGDELERAHIGAEWAMAATEEGEDPNTFKAALDAVSWDANNKTAGCSIPTGQSRLDVTISGYNIPATIAASELTIEKVYLGFTLASGTTYALAPKGMFGGISTLGEIGFTEFVIYDPALAAGIGDQEAYLGARAGALFSEVQAEVAFLAGRTCNQDILLELDPKVAQFIELPPNGFTGAYARGSASFPVISTGCPLTVGVGADFGAWVLVGEPTTLGGLVGGGAYGKVACVGALRGQVRALGQVNTDGDMTFVGEGFGVAGVGSCEPAGWTSVSRSRNDSWCATGDARFQAGYQNGWSVMDLSVSAVH